jgi:hypothetical protein
MAPPSSPVATVTVVLPATPHALMTVSRETLVSSPITSYRASKTLLARFSQSGRQERRRCVQARFGSSRHEDAVGHARVEMHVVVERRAEVHGDRAVFQASPVELPAIDIHRSDRIQPDRSRLLLLVIRPARPTLAPVPLADRSLEALWRTA